MEFKRCLECRLVYELGSFQDHGEYDPRSYICRMCAGDMTDLPEGHPSWVAAARVAELELQRCLPVEWRSNEA